jgi:hypothetical protein
LLIENFYTIYLPHAGRACVMIHPVKAVEPPGSKAAGAAPCAAAAGAIPAEQHGPKLIAGMGL